jgi:hypothetical protein
MEPSFACLCCPLIAFVDKNLMMARLSTLARMKQSVTVKCAYGDTGGKKAFNPGL